MKSTSSIVGIVPVLPTADMARDLRWYTEHTGFEVRQADDLYAVLRRDQFYFHLQWHADTEEDPLLGGSVMRIFVNDIHPIFEEFVERQTVPTDKLQLHTPWNTHEFGFYDLNNNAVFIVQSL